jgi:hypothetical protein
MSSVPRETPIPCELQEEGYCYDPNCSVSFCVKAKEQKLSELKRWQELRESIGVYPGARLPKTKI